MPDNGEILLTSRKFKVERRREPTRSGGTRERDLVVHPGAVVILPLLDAETVVMIRNQRPAAGQRLLELPAGTLEAGEPPAECAARELIEETGYRAARVAPFIEFYPSPGILTERMYAFIARDLEHVGQKLEADEDITVEPVALDRIRQLLTDGSLYDGKTIAVLGTYLLRSASGQARG